ncbi:MAG: cellulase family glycosylhydrolase, partial [Eubacteriales bacterium]
FEKRLITAGREFKAAADLGFNSVRLILQFEVWDREHDIFMQNFDRYLSAAYSHGISSMICLGNDCAVPKDAYREPELGEQTVEPGWHGGRRSSPHGKLDGSGYSILDDPDKNERFCEMIREIVTKYAHDERVCIWDIFNEPGNSMRGSKSLRYMEHFFEIARAADPCQPLTAGIWQSNSAIAGKMPEIERRAAELSDVISFHCYERLPETVLLLDILEDYGRPLICSEWLLRITGQSVQSIFPLFYSKRIACYNWGLVAGKYQTYEPWNMLWEQYDRGEGGSLDFTKWQHDLLRPNLRPYDPGETELIKRLCNAADKKFDKKGA